MVDVSRARRVALLLRNLVLAVVFYSFFYTVVWIYQNPQYTTSKLRVSIPFQQSSNGGLVIPEDIKPSQSAVKVRLAGSSETVTINPHANVFNRPNAAVKARDDYMGPRPDVDTEADLNLLVEECRGSYEKLDKMRDVYECIKFLAEGEDRYYYLPDEKDRASMQDPTKAEYENADGHDNTLKRYVSQTEAVAPSRSSPGSCPGPIIPYHVYWTGPATWRVEVFIKSYLYTQNLACSRLWLWLDADHNPNAVNEMLNHDPLFARFLPLVERGDVTLKEWKFPSRISLPRNEDNTDGVGYYNIPGKPNAKGEFAVADGIIEDADGQQWLVLTPKQMTFLPVAVSDAMRFVVLHQYGGAYFDMDVLMLRDMRPLLLRKDHAFAERWAAHPHPGDYNTAIMSLSANSSISSYLIRGGVRMGLNFHPRVIGRMAWKDGRNDEFLMLETAAFDPIWPEFNWQREGRCIVPCFRNYADAFKGRRNAIRGEWESYDGDPLEAIALDDMSQQEKGENGMGQGESGDVLSSQRSNALESQLAMVPSADQRIMAPGGSFVATGAEEAELRRAGVVQDYKLEDDSFPPNNRTLENFFRGAWSYHVHNQVGTFESLFFLKF